MVIDLEIMSRNTEASLCSPFKWCHIPEGRVALQDAAAYGGTKGGQFHLADFAIAKYPITNGQYECFLEDPNGFRNGRWWDYSLEAGQWHKERLQPKPTAFDGPDLPRTRVSWFDSLAFCAWLSDRLYRSVKGNPLNVPDLDSWCVRLPTEKEWQRAALGDRDWQYPWGNQFEENKGNYGKVVGHPTKVGSYPQGQSPYGAMDMIGNVWEWCLSPWGKEGEDVGGYTYRVFRGGAWNVSNPEHLSPTDRYGHPPRGRLNDVGFRIAYCY